MKYALLTFGCRVNQADSLVLERTLRAQGATGAQPGAADLVIVNTCAVTARAEQASRHAIRRISRLNPAASIVVTGCYATRRPAEVQALAGGVRIVPNADKRTAALARDAETVAGPAAWPWPDVALPRPAAMGRTVYTLAVQSGCDESCSYCVVPAARGRGRSMPVAAVLAEVDRVVEAGFRELMLTGVHLGSYGRDLGGGVTLARLLRLLAERPGDLLIRVGSIEPMDFTADVEDVLVGSDRFAPHVHLPLQHASDRVLEAMRRPYTLSRYRQLVDRLRTRAPHAAIGADVMVGFPGERDEDVRTLRDYLESSSLGYLHVFPYSPRPGTPATRLPGRVAGSLVRTRAREVREIAHRLAARFRAAAVGTTRRALTVEDGSRVVTDNYLKLRLPAGLPRNERVWVRVVAEGRGELVSSNSRVST